MENMITESKFDSKCEIDEIIESGIRWKKFVKFLNRHEPEHIASIVKRVMPCNSANINQT